MQFRLACEKRVLITLTPDEQVVGSCAAKQIIMNLSKPEQFHGSSASSSSYHV